MSSATHHMSIEDQVRTMDGPSSPQSWQRDLSADHCDSKPTSPICSPPNSSASFVNDADGTHGDSMSEWPLTENSLVDNPVNAQPIASPKDSVHVGGSTNLHQTFNCSVNVAEDVFNEDIDSLWMGSFQDQIVCMNIKASSLSIAYGHSPLDSCETSYRSSTEKDSRSLSSREMVMRSNSFSLDDHFPSISFIEESMSSTVGSAAVPAEVPLFSGTLPDVCEGHNKECVFTEGDPEGDPRENTVPLFFGMTFILADQSLLPAEENHTPPSKKSPVGLPSKKGDRPTTFLCDRSPAVGTSIGAVVVPSPHFTGSLSLEHANTSGASPVQSSGNGVQTSTPIQHNGNDVVPLSLSESPCAESHATPAKRCSAEAKRATYTSQNLAARLPPSASRGGKIEIKRFPKPNYSSVKSKVITRPPHQAPLTTDVALVKSTPHKPSHVGAHPFKPFQVNKSENMKINHGNGVNNASPTTVSDTPLGVSAGLLYMTFDQGDQCDFTGTDGAADPSTTEVRASIPNQLTAFPPLLSEESPTSDLIFFSQGEVTSGRHAANQTFSLSSSAETRDRNDHKDPKQLSPILRPRQDELSDRNAIKHHPVSSQGKPPVTKKHGRCSSESSSALSKPPRTPAACSFSNHKTEFHQMSKTENLITSSICKGTKTPSPKSSRGVRKLSLVSSNKTGAASEGQSRFGSWPSPKRTKAGLTTSAPAAWPSSIPLPIRHRQGASGKDVGSTSTAFGLPQFKLKSQTGTTTNQRPHATENSSSGDTAAAGNTAAQVNGLKSSLPLSRPAALHPPCTYANRLPRGHKGPARTNQPDAHPGKQVAVPKTQLLKTSSFRTVLKTVVSTPASKTAASNSPCVSKSATPLKGCALLRLAHQNTGTTVDKGRAKAGSRQPQPAAAAPAWTNGPPDLVPVGVVHDHRCGSKDRTLRQCRELLGASNCRFEAIAVVLQQVLTERDGAMKRRRELSQELVTLQGDLASSAEMCKRLEQEKEAFRVSVEETVRTLQEQHHKELARLERRLEAFYQAEWDKVHLTYQEESNKCKALMEKQMTELRENHEAMKLELEASQAQQLQCVKQHYEDSLEELRKVHSQELQTLGLTLKETEAGLSDQIQKMTAENDALVEKQTAEENRRRRLADNNQKDSHTLYLEQELESLKVVLDIKNKQLHQQEKKLIQMNKVIEKNLNMDENIKKVRQENEDLKARMDKHAALSRQLSTEQAALQESLQKESKVNKRLSMENEELLWKLHSGDSLNSPNKLSPTSPSHSLHLHSPRNSTLFSSPPFSPR